jgi:membrane protein implicated in regulation of membrane protease activity
MQAQGGVADKIDSFVGKAVVLTEGIGPRGKGKGELRGTSWTVVNLGESALSAGDTRPVERVDGLTLFVR